MEVVEVEHVDVKDELVHDEGANGGGVTLQRSTSSNTLEEREAGVAKRAASTTGRAGSASTSPWTLEEREPGAAKALPEPGEPSGAGTTPVTSNTLEEREAGATGASPAA